MAHYAEINENNEVIYVVYMDNEIITDENGNEVEQMGIDHLHTHHGSDRRWVRTSYNGNFRNKYAGIGDIYREDLDMFIPKSPHSSWILNETLGGWEPPISQPQLSQEESDSGYVYIWDEESYLNENKGWILTKIF